MSGFIETGIGQIPIHRVSLIRDGARVGGASTHEVHLERGEPIKGFGPAEDIVPISHIIPALPGTFVAWIGTEKKPAAEKDLYLIPVVAWGFRLDYAEPLTTRGRWDQTSSDNIAIIFPSGHVEHLDQTYPDVAEFIATINGLPVE